MALIYTLFFFSGFSSLTLQVAWTRILGQEIGIDYYSQVVVVSVFMIGLGVGGLIGGAVARVTRRPAALFAVAELAIALFAAFSPEILRAAPPYSILLATNFGLGNLTADFIVYLAILIVPVALMGSSLPIVVKIIEGSAENAGALVGRVYAINIFGAVAGTLASGMALIGLFGLKATVIVAAVTNLALALVVAWRMRRHTLPNSNLGFSLQLAVPPIWIGLAFAVGFVAIGYEIFFFRTAVYYFGATSYVFPVALAAFLLWLYVGTRGAGYLLARGFPPRELLIGGALLAIAATGVPLVMPHIVEAICGPFFMQVTWLKDISRWQDFAGMAVVIFASMLPVGLVSLAFPAFVELATRRTEMTAEVTGQIYFAQTIGNFFGALLTGGVLVIHLGTINTALLFGAMLGAIAIVVAWREGGTHLRTATAMAGVVTPLLLAGLAISYFHPFNLSQNRMLSRISEQREGTAMIFEDIPNRHGASVYIGAEPASSYNYVRKVKECLWPLNVALTQIGRPPKRVLIIGLGTGFVVTALHQLYPNADIRIAELLDVLVKEMRERGYANLRKTIGDSSVYVIDGSRFSKENANFFRGTVDLIQIGVLHVTSSGAGNLFTREFFTLMKSFLTPEGVLTFNAYPSAVKAGAELFPEFMLASFGPSQVANVFFSEKSFDGIGSRLRQFDASINSDDVEPCIPKAASLITNKSAILEKLKSITVQTNDQVSSENFLFHENAVYRESEPYMQRSCFAPPRASLRATDIRKWPTDISDCDYTCMTGLPPN